MPFFFQKLIICIPAYKEKNLILTLNSLAKCYNENFIIQIFILINGSKNDEEEIVQINLNSYKETLKWISNYKGNLNFNCHINLDLPIKEAGVGLARKILGDEASNIFKQNGEDGIIVYLDADCEVSYNYFQEIANFFHETNLDATALHFEHHLTNLPIIEYESHLRYYILMQKWLNLPYAIHTVGSSMAVKSSAYLKKGGMNKRKAGEDFYFLHKFIKDQTCGTIKTLSVYPSSRSSDRVPFGTGRAILAYNQLGFVWETYNPASFLILKPFIDNLEEFYNQNIDFSDITSPLKEYLKIIHAKEKINEIKNNVSSLEAFKKRFYQYFDAFQLMKTLHYLKGFESYKNLPIHKALDWFFEIIVKEKKIKDPKERLMKLRILDLM